jgi:hypothetical protein
MLKLDRAWQHLTPQKPACYEMSQRACDLCVQNFSQKTYVEDLEVDVRIKLNVS